MIKELEIEFGKSGDKKMVIWNLETIQIKVNKYLILMVSYIMD